MGWALCGILNKYLNPITLLGQFDTWMENNIRQYKNCAQIYSKPKEMKVVSIQILVSKFIAALLAIAPNLKQPILVTYYPVIHISVI